MEIILEMFILEKFLHLSPGTHKVILLERRISFIKELGPVVFSFYFATEMFCSIWYHLYNFKNVKTPHRGVLSLQLY